ncbi:hypothetical protein [Frankia sp. CcWB3]
MELLEHAAAEADRLHMVFPAALARLRAGEVNRSLRRRPKAEENLRSALETFTSLGARTYAERCHRLLASLGGPDAAAGSRTGMTRLKLQLLRRILRGDDFDAISAELYISRGHAENLARDLYRLHGVASRAELAGLYLGLRGPGPHPLSPLDPDDPPSREDPGPDLDLDPPGGG